MYVFFHLLIFLNFFLKTNSWIQLCETGLMSVSIKKLWLTNSISRMKKLRKWRLHLQISALLVLLLYIYLLIFLKTKQLYLIILVSLLNYLYCTLSHQTFINLIVIIICCHFFRIITWSPITYALFKSHLSDDLLLSFREDTAGHGMLSI